MVFSEGKYVPNSFQSVNVSKGELYTHNTNSDYSVDYFSWEMYIETAHSLKFSSRLHITTIALCIDMLLVSRHTLSSFH